MKVAAPPHTIESVLSGFLPRYAVRFPNVHVELTEALGPEQSGLLERGEVHLGIRLDQRDPRYESRVLPPVEALAVGAASLELGESGRIEIGRLASYPLLLLINYSVRRACSTRLVASQMSSRKFCSRAVHRTLCLLWRRLGKG